MLLSCLCRQMPCHSLGGSLIDGGLNLKVSSHQNCTPHLFSCAAELPVFEACELSLVGVLMTNWLLITVIDRIGLVF